jgi:hypothetical protein
MEAQTPVPNPPSRQDINAVVGVLLEVSGEFHREHLHGDHPEDHAVSDGLAARLKQRLAAVRLLPSDADTPQLSLALDNLSQRMRYALGEYKAPPEPDIGLWHHDVWFWSSRARAAFLRDIEHLGLRGRPSRRWLRAWAVVTTTELIGSDAFDRRVEQIREAAQRHGGDYDGASA